VSAKISIRICALITLNFSMKLSEKLFVFEQLTHSRIKTYIKQKNKATIITSATSSTETFCRNLSNDDGN